MPSVEVTRMGFPPRSWFGYRTMGMHAFPVLYGGLAAADPAYFEEFWTEPGYLGSRDAPFAACAIGSRRSSTIVGLLTEDGSSARPDEAGRTHPGRARGGVDIAWRGADGRRTPTGRDPAVGHAPASTSRGPTCS